MIDPKESVLRGCRITEIDGRWCFADTLEDTVDTWEQRPCGFCDKPFTPEGHDACLGTLPDVLNACCGHGDPDAAYIQFDYWTCIHGPAAVTFFNTIARRENDANS